MCSYPALSGWFVADFSIRPSPTGDSTTMSAVFTFTAPPALGPNVPFRFGVMGDMGQTNNSAHTMQMMIEGGYQHNLLIGDLSYVRVQCLS
jgi:hypothetical protein